MDLYPLVEVARIERPKLDTTGFKQGDRVRIHDSFWWFHALSAQRKGITPEEIENDFVFDRYELPSGESAWSYVRDAKSDVIYLVPAGYLELVGNVFA